MVEKIGIDYQYVLLVFEKMSEHTCVRLLFSVM
jgi:hypothetical protein